MRFTDLPDTHWSYSYVAYLYCRSIIGGYTDGTFHPNDDSTRGQFAKMLVLGMGWNLYNPIYPSFNDVAPDSTYYQYIETAYLRGVLGGYTDGTFRPNSPITRAQAAKMLVSARGWGESFPPFPTFDDVPSDHWSYGFVEAAASRAVIGGYTDGTFRPNSSTTRGQTTKMLIGAFNLDIHSEGGPHFADVPADNPFYNFVETASFYRVVGGYPCGSEGEPCDDQNRPYFRPDNLVTRSQITKISVLTAQQANPVSWQLVAPTVATFVDMPTNNVFYAYIETAVAKGIIGGYECGGEGEPCPGRYFHPQSDATRAQISKITFLAALVP